MKEEKEMQEQFNQMNEITERAKSVLNSEYYTDFGWVLPSNKKGCLSISVGEAEMNDKEFVKLYSVWIESDTEEEFYDFEKRMKNGEQ